MKYLPSLLLCLLLCSCTTIETTFPDGRVVKTSSLDPTAATLIGQAITAGAASLPRGYSK